MIRLANLSNGLIYPHDDICYFQSMYGHHAKLGYFRIDSMPISATIHLLKGGEIAIIDATHHQNKHFTDAQKFGVTTWCMVFNRACQYKNIKVVDWQTPEMKQIALSRIQKPVVQTIRKLIKFYGFTKPAIIGDNVKLICYKSITFDDKPEEIRRLLNQ